MDAIVYGLVRIEIPPDYDDPKLPSPPDFEAVWYRWIGLLNTRSKFEFEYMRHRLWPLMGKI